MLFDFPTLLFVGSKYIKDKAKKNEINVDNFLIHVGDDHNSNMMMHQKATCRTYVKNVMGSLVRKHKQHVFRTFK